MRAPKISNNIAISESMLTGKKMASPTEVSMSEGQGILWEMFFEAKRFCHFLSTVISFIKPVPKAMHFILCKIFLIFFCEIAVTNQ